MAHVSTFARGAFALVLLWSAPSLAQSSTEDALIRRGLELRAEGHDGEALTQFREAYERSHSARARAQMGMAEQALGRWVDADQHLREALAQAQDPWVMRTRPVLEQALAVIQQHVGRVEVRGNVPGAVVRIDGRQVGTLPLVEAVPVIAGTVTLEVGAPGHYPVSRQLVVPAASLVRESVDLAPVPETPVTSPVRVTAPTGATSAAPVVEPRTSPPTVAVVTAPRVAPASSRRTFAWVSAAAAAALVGGGVALLVAGNAAVTRYNNDDNCLPASGARRYDACGGDYDGGTLMQSLGVTGLVVGGGLAVTSAVLFLTAPTRRGASARFTCGHGPGELGVSCAGVF